jgi:LuxR family maltose regulon positive regulatory protein
MGLPASSPPKTRPARRLQVAHAGPAFDFLDSKIQIPALRPGTVSRTALVNRLRAANSYRAAVVAAPAGYGKTTLLSQWAERDARPFSWVTLDPRDNDPLVLLRHIAAALDRDEPVERSVIQALRSPGRSIWTAAVPRVAAALGARAPLVLVLDDVNLLRSRDSLETLAALIGDEEDGSMLVLSGRVAPKLPLAHLRATGRLLELGAEELALTKREAQLLLRATGVSLNEPLADELIGKCEGWPAALYLAALSIRDASQRGESLAPFDGDDRYLADYFRSEYLSRLRPGPLRFLRRTSVLEQMSGALCDAILEDEGSGRELERIERANLFLVPLDNRREWYRYHHLFQGLLRRELEETEPELVAELHGRAADWYEAHGDDESALEHAYAAGDIDRAAQILAAIAYRMYDSGREAALEGWLERFEGSGQLERYPAVALHGARVHALSGRAEQAERCLETAKLGTFRGKPPDGSSSLKPWVDVLRAWLCRAGAKQMLADAQAALAGFPKVSEWRPSALLAKGCALMLLDRPEDAAEALDEAAECSRAHCATETQIVALCERALLAAEREDHALADELSEQANRLVATLPGEGCAARAAGNAATARMMLRHGHWNEARAALTGAQGLLPSLSAAVPWLSVQTRIELARGFVTLRDADAARALLDESEEIMAGLPDLGVLAARTKELRQEVESIPDSNGARTMGLTPAELRLLPLLSTHLSFREIADQLFLSRNTIKTQAISLYRKLGVASRSEAISEAQRLGLAEHLLVLIGDDA